MDALREFSTGQPHPEHPVQSTLDNGASDDYDAFVAKLDPTGTKLLYSTFLGGAADDGAAGIAVDAGGNAYVTGTSNSGTGFPGAPAVANRFGIFVAKLDPQGALVYTFIHPSGSAGGIALDLPARGIGRAPVIAHRAQGGTVKECHRVKVEHEHRRVGRCSI